MTTVRARVIPASINKGCGSKYATCRQCRVARILSGHVLSKSAPFDAILPVVESSTLVGEETDAGADAGADADAEEGDDDASAAPRGPVEIYACDSSSSITAT